MKCSQLFLPTLKNIPSEAEIASHRLMLRAGMIRRLASGLYTYLPLGLRALRKVEAIVREEMVNAGAQEIMMPIVQPAELWQESGRWDRYGRELLRIKDRHDRAFCLGPTHEEVITDLVRREVRSYRDMPLNLFQIHTKFRDEIRPRFGLMRAREFVMKDAYSFDVDEEALDRQYWNMYNAYMRIFERCGLEFKAVKADTGAIGGDVSHEFMVIADTGEDTVCSCLSCSWAANIELAEVRNSEISGQGAQDNSQLKELKKVSTPDVKTIEDVAKFLCVDTKRLVKSILFSTSSGEHALAMVRGDHEVNEVKLKRAIGCDDIFMADENVVLSVTGADVGFAGPVGLKESVRIFADNSIRGVKDFITGANEKDAHLLNVNWQRDIDLSMVTFADIRNITDHDLCPECGGRIELKKGIEVGHVFKLGTKYSEALGAAYLDKDGKERPIIMGCYGIGVSRVVQAAIEQNNDKNGIIFPTPIAPFELIITVINTKDKVLLLAAKEIYDIAEQSNIDCLLDDRNIRAGAKFKDADLIGIPVRITVGKRLKDSGEVEVFFRRNGAVKMVSFDDIKENLLRIISFSD